MVASSSFFVPKPFTPFQWARMCTKEEFLERANIVRGKFREMKNFKSLKYNWHEAELTVLEGVLARGDRRVGAVIEEAYRNGAIYDSWSEYFNNEAWMKAFEELRRGHWIFIPPGSEAWTRYSLGISSTPESSKEFLNREWKHAMKERGDAQLPSDDVPAAERRNFGGGVCYETAYRGIGYMKIRIKFSKYGNMKFIGHLDVMRYFQKAIRRADVDIRYSGGFSPHQIMSFAAPLGVGITSNGASMWTSSCLARGGARGP